VRYFSAVYLEPGAVEYLALDENDHWPAWAWARCPEQRERGQEADA